LGKAYTYLRFLWETMDLTAFVVESVLMTFGALVLESFSLRQVIHDIIEGERWRYLTASHYLTQVASILFVIQSIDSQGGLGIFSQAAILFLGNVKGFCQIASARALAAGFVDSHKLMTKGPQGPPMGLILFVVHGILMLFAITFFLVLFVTRNTWCSVAARCFFSLYSLVVGAQVIVSAWKVRSILVEEMGRTGKYGSGIQKLTRLILLVIVILAAGNASLFMLLSSDIDLAKKQSQLSEGQGPFVPLHIFGDFTSLLTSSMLLLGAWSTSQKVATTPSSRSRKSTIISTRRLERASTREFGSTGPVGGSTGSTGSETAIEMNAAKDESTDIVS